MFQFLFKYPANVFSRGTPVLLGSWPRWLLFLLILVVIAGLGWSILRSKLPPVRSLTLWLLQSAIVALLLLLLWQPAMSITALRAQQNIVAVLVDSSHSMALQDVDGKARLQRVKELLNNGILRDLQSRFQVRLYRLDEGTDRVKSLEGLTADGRSTQINRALRELASEAGSLPIGAAILLSDGADSTGGIDNETMSALRRRHLPVNTVGVGALSIEQDAELESVQIPLKTLPGSRVAAQIRIRQRGLTGERAKLTLSTAGRTVASQDVVYRNTAEQTETLEFQAGSIGIRSVEARLDPVRGEKNTENNRRTQIMAVQPGKRRVLYIEGEPRWDYKFIRRALEDDPAVAVVSMLRTTQNKIYRQGLANSEELSNGFPTTATDLFSYDALLLGSVEASFLSPAQQTLIERFADLRGGGVLWTGGRFGLADGGYGVAPFTGMLPVTLPNRKNTFQRSFVAAELTDAGRDSLLCRIEPSKEKSVDHWEILPYLANFQDPGLPKAGATVLLRVNNNGTHLPLLITQNYGRGRTAVFATGGSWRWRMQQPLADQSEETFWRQLLRWTVTGTPGPVSASMASVSGSSSARLEDDGHLMLRAEVRDKAYQLAGDAEVQAQVSKPDGSSEQVPLRADPNAPGRYLAEWNAPAPGSYTADITAVRGQETLGRDTLPFRREDGVAENFGQEQNRDLLTQLAEQTGGQYYTLSEARRIPNEIAYSDAGVTAREYKDLWDMPLVFLLLVALKAGEWMVRRRWGAV